MRCVKVGDTIGIVSPAFAMPHEDLSAITKVLEARGFKGKIFGADDPAYGRLAGDDAARARNLQAAFGDDGVAAILCARGGYGSVRLLDLLDFDAIAARPKPFIGYSDATTLIKHLVDDAGLFCFHGPMGIDLISKDCAASVETLFDVICGRSTSVCAAAGEFTALKCGSARGTLSGGNITVLESLVGARFAPFKRPTILLLEDVGEYAYRLDRTLWHFRREGLLDGVVGAVFADLKMQDDCEPNSLGVPVRDIIAEHFAHVDGPLAIDMPCGHTDSQLTVPFGAEVELTVSQDCVTINFSDLWEVSHP